MNVVLWILQILLALHTFIGAMWKSANSEQLVPALQALPHGIWMTLIVIEFFCSVGLIVPAFLSKPARRLVPIAAICVAAEMLLFCVLFEFSESQERSEVLYWLIVAAVCGFIAYGRWRLKPL